MMKGLFITIFLASVQSFATPVIHEVTKKDSIETIDQKYLSSDNQQSVESINKHKENQLIIPKKHLIISPKSIISFCRYQVNQGDWVASLIRRFGYNSPYSLDLIHSFSRKNEQLDNINQISPGQIIEIPILHVKKNEKEIINQSACKNLEQFEGLIVRDKNYNLKESLLEDSSINSSADDEFSSTERKKGNGSQNYFYFGLSGLYDSLHEDTDDEAIIISELQPKVTVEWARLIRNNLELGLGMQVSFQSYLENEKQNKRILERKQSLLSLYLLANYQVSSDWNLYFSTGKREVLSYSKNQAFTEYTLFKESSFFIDMKPSYLLYQSHNFSFYLDSYIRQTLKSKNYLGGTDYGAGLKLKTTYQKNEIEIFSLYHQGQFKTEQLNYEHRWLEIGAKYKWRF